MLTVYGAASLGPALEEMKAVYPGEFGTLRVSTGSSTALKTQIEEGATADLYLSADTTNPQALVDAGLTNGAAVAFATNRLTVIVPNGNPAGITSPIDLAREGVRVIAAGENVPITKYAEQCVGNLAAIPGYPPAFAASYESNIVSREENVGAVVAKIQLGEGDAAFVYVTHARSADVDEVELPVEANVVATYAGVVLKRAHSPIATRRLLDWIRGGEGQRILSELGFSPAP